VSTYVSRIGALQRRFPVVQVLVIVVLFAYGAISLDSFVTETNIDIMLVLAAILAIAAVGQTLVFILGGIDLSIPGFIYAGSVMAVELSGPGGKGIPLLVTVLIAVIAFGTLGGITGYLCHRFRIQPLIVSLGMGAVALGFSQVATGGQAPGEAPEALQKLAIPSGTTFGFISEAPVVIILLVVAIVVGYLLHRSIAGRQLFATGDNPRGADLAHVPTAKVRVATFAISGVAAAMAGFLLAGGADVNVGQPFLFQGLAAVVVGGTTIFGARGDYTHTVLGALLLTLLSQILVGHGADQADQQVLFGLLILAVVAAYGRDARLKDRI
jgi:ribose transport system permease protein